MSSTITIKNNEAHKMIQQFSKFYEIYDSVNQYINIEPAINDSILNKREWLERLAQAQFPIAFLGTYSAGKSTTINAILKKDVLPENMKSTTAFPTLIKKGEKNQAVIYYLSREGKYELQGFLIKELAEQLGEKLAISNRDTFIAELERKIIEQSHKGNKIKQDAFIKLSQLFAQWDSFYDKKIITLEQARDYIEGHPESLFIERMEIEVDDIDLPEEMVFVDLPGLNVSNDQHIKITEEYIKGKAKAFVICTDRTLEGREINLLDEINRSPQWGALKRSFWLINKIDLFDAQQKKEIEESFHEMTKKHQFTLSAEKVFKVSAQNYSLLTHIAQGTLEQTHSLKSHLEQLDKIDGGREAKLQPALAKELLLSNPETAEFVKFEKSLFNYLNATAKQEFIDSARCELTQLITDLSELIKPDYQLYQQYGENKQLEQIVFSNEVDKELDNFVKQLTSNIETVIKDVRLIDKSNLWHEQAQHNLIAEIHAILSESPDDIKNALRKGTDVDNNVWRLPFIVDERLSKNNYWRKSIVEAVNYSYVKEFHAKLLNKLLNANRKYLPENVIEFIKDKLNGRDVEMRLYGLADGILYKFTEEFNNIVMGEFVQLSSDEREQKAVDIFKTQLEHFVLTTLNNELNRNIWRTIKNHAEYLEQEIMTMLATHRSAIHNQIAKTVNLSERIEAEARKSLTIKTAWLDLIKLEQDL